MAEVKVGDLVDLEVRGLAAGGAGIADLPDGRVVFVPRTAPGDVISARVDRLRPRWGSASLATLSETGPERVTPACPRFGSCGGCSLQHVAYDEQRRWKARFVADAMTRIAKMPVPEPEVVGSPVTEHYRDRITFTVRRLRGGRTVAGFHALEQTHRIVDVGKECLLPESSLLEAWAGIRRTWSSGSEGLPRARELRVTLRAVDDGVQVVVRGGAPGWRAAGMMERIPGAVGIWHQPHGRDHAELVAGSAGTISLGIVSQGIISQGIASHDTDEQRTDAQEEARIPVFGTAFTQVNPSAAGLLVPHVLAQATSGASATERGTTQSRAVDAYCGIGVYGRGLARQGWSVVGIEADPAACASARHEAPHGLDVLEGTVEAHLDQALRDGSTDAVLIVNPPRTGLAPAVTDTIVARQPRRLVYVSCDPATLARDTARLSTGYELVSLRCFDLFPHTAHVETVAVFDVLPED